MTYYYGQIANTLKDDKVNERYKRLGIENYINEMGKCPRCKGMNLDYGVVQHEESMCYYPYTCEDCGLQGEEWYNMDFAGHNIITENGDNIEL